MSEIFTNYPKISIITVSYNAEEFIEQSIKSVICQKYKNYEYIIIDGGSKDKTKEIIQSYSKYIHYWVSEKDNGIYDAFNKGVRAATGEWVYFLGTDDILWNCFTLEFIVNYLHQQKCICPLFYGEIALLSTENKIVRFERVLWNYQRIIKHGIMIPHQALFVNRKLFDLYGLFDLSLNIAADYEWLIRVTKNEGICYIPGMIVAAMRVGGLSSKRENGYELLRQFRLAQIKNNLNPLPVILMLRIIKAKFFNKLIIREKNKW